MLARSAKGKKKKPPSARKNKLLATAPITKI